MYAKLAPLILIGFVACDHPYSIDTRPDAGVQTASPGSGSDPSSQPQLGFDAASGDDSSAAAPAPDSASGGDASATTGDDSTTTGDDATVAETSTGDDGSGQVTDAALADDGLAATCATKLCIDPIFDCILQGCGAAVCQNLHCVIPTD